LEFIRETLEAGTVSSSAKTLKIYYWIPKPYTVADIEARLWTLMFWLQTRSADFRPGQKREGDRLRAETDPLSITLPW